MGKRYHLHDKITVLNFANPENPGDGVYLGAMVQEECLRRSSNLPEPLEWRLRRSPALPIEDLFTKDETFNSWQVGNRYFGKQFSILGDSISTLDGYNPKGYKVFYAGENCVRSGVTAQKDTWWDKVIDFFGGELLVNNSWSGSRVTKLPEREQLFPSGCSDERTSSLHINDVNPDVIIVYLGTNDWASGVKTGNETRLLGIDENEYFDTAYNTMLKKLKNRYPESEIWCCTLSETYISKNPDFEFPHKHAGTHIEEYNEIIRETVWDNRCRLIDLYDFMMAYDSIDGSHPTQSGMNTIATMMIRSMVGAEENQFLDCEDNLCRYVMRDPEITMPLYSNILRLTIESTGKKIQFQKNVVEVGCDKNCDLLLEGKLAAARCQATFFYEKNMWFLRDNFTTNGTWINGEKIQPGKKYQLIANDEINFAMAERIIFDKQEYHAQPVEKYIGEIIDGKYEVVKLIGRGGFNTIYLVRDVHTNKNWAMKVCDKKKPHYSLAVRESILMEPHMVMKLNHPAIPKVLDIIENEEGIFIIREYIEGETLETIVKMHGAQPADKVVEWGKQLCDALGYIHSLTPPHIYRDMKPANVILKPDGTIKIIDFDTMRTYEEKQSYDTWCFGTVGYAAPEQYGSGHTDIRADIYGLGMTMFRLVSGINPAKYEIKPICKINPSLPKGLEYIITKCTRRNPDERYQSCSELMADLNNYMDLPKPKGSF